MAGDLPFDRTVINSLERPMSGDINQLQVQLDRAIRDLVRSTYTVNYTDVVTGFIAQGFKVLAAGGSMNVTICPGFGFIDDGYGNGASYTIGGVQSLDDPSQWKPLVLNTVQSGAALTVPAAPSSGNSRYDIIEVTYKPTLGNPTSRDTLNTSTGVFTTGLVNKTLTCSLDGTAAQVTTPSNSTTGIGYKVGTPATTGAQQVPPTTSGYLKVATILVTGGTSTISQSAITDNRTTFATIGSLLTTANSWSALQTFAAGLSVSNGLAVSGNTTLTGAQFVLLNGGAGLSFVKNDNGDLAFGTAANSNGRITFLTGGSVRAIIDDTTGALNLFAGMNALGTSVTGLPTPVNGSDAATKTYVDTTKYVVAGHVSNNGTTATVDNQTGSVTASATRSSLGQVNVVVAGLSSSSVTIATIDDARASSIGVQNGSGSFNCYTSGSGGSNADANFGFLVAKL